MAAVVKTIHPGLSDVGFRKRRHTFNRSAEPGIIQVINFQMGQRSLQGQFTVNFGIAIEEAWSLRSRDSTGQFPAFVNEYDCEFRQRLSQLRGEPRDIWWDLRRPAKSLSAEISDIVLGEGTTWLEARATREKLLAIWRTGGSVALPSSTPLPIVAILSHLNRSDEAAATLRRYYGGIAQVSHQWYVHDLGRHLGIDLPAPA
jgi:hypothetical protein